jgi:hypothetical protein
LLAVCAGSHYFPLQQPADSIINPAADPIECIIKGADAAATSRAFKLVALTAQATAPK